MTSSVLLIGNPNSGKSLLFNRLTGLNQKVVNFPGVTVEIRSGQCNGMMLHDFPGIYSLQPLTRDEIVAVQRLKQAFQESETRCLLYVMDATRFERSLFLLLQLLEEARKHDCKVVVALNVVDELFARQARIHVDELARELGVVVVPVSAKTSLGLDSLKQRLEQTLQGPTASSPSAAHSGTTALSESPTEAVKRVRMRARQLAQDYGPQGDLLLVGQNRLDSFFLSSFGGAVTFILIMLFLFQAIFSWAAPFMDFISSVVSSAGSAIASLIPNATAADFVKDAVFEGVGSFLTFMPQIFILFVIIGVLEDSGYLARTTIMFHRPLSWFGLTGRSFVPLLSGHACAIPAIMATRTIESPRRRLVTIFTIPFMACSARIPVYALLIAGFVPALPFLGGLITLQGLSFFLLYALGIITGLAAATVLTLALRGQKSQTQDAPFVVELPPYRVPNIRPILRHSASRTLDFVQKAGATIFTVTVVIWFLGYFPQGAGHLDESYLGRMGHAIEGFFRPMGMDWKIGVAVITSFLAREVFVGTLGTLYGMDNASDDIQTLSRSLQSSGMTLASAAALLVFFALSMQCVSTLAVMKKETGSRWLPVGAFTGMTALAYVLAMLTYNILK
jgi:ferrous iron transport protein B